MKLGPRSVKHGLVHPFWTLGRIVAVWWTRRLPPDGDLVSTAWQLALLGIVSPLVVKSIHSFHNYLDPIPPNFRIDEFYRSVDYQSYAVTLFLVIELGSLAIGMGLARRKKRVLWWVAPQMVILMNVIWMRQLFMIGRLTNQFQNFLSGDAGIVLQFLPLIGAFAVTGTWIWWVFTPTETERLARELAAERLVREQSTSAKSTRHESQT